MLEKGIKSKVKSIWIHLKKKNLKTLKTLKNVFFGLKKASLGSTSAYKIEFINKLS